MNWRAYPRCKDSGIEWIGEIPEHWETRRLKYVSTYNDDVLGENTDPDSEMLYVDISSVDSISGIQKKELMRFENAPSRARRQVRNGDVIISTVRTYLRAIAPIAEPEINLTVSTGFAVIRPKKDLDSSFASYALRAPYFVDSVVTRSVGVSYPAINATDLVNLRVVFPPLLEQRAIAAFLYREIAQIDTLIEKKQKQIAFLQEKRTTLISHAVTKGLDPNVKMKDSGVEWLGEIPGHWRVLQIKRLSLVKRGASPRPIDDPKYFDEEGEYSWVRIADVTSSDRYLEVTSQRLSPLGKSLSVPLEPGAIFLSIAGSVGKPIITKIKCCIHDGFVYFPRFRGNTEFLYYIFVSGQLYGGLGKLGTQLNLNTDTVGSIHIGYPAEDEQSQIVAFLDYETARIDVLSQKVQESIEKLREYRTALISAAVTGKIDVRKEAV